MRDCGATTNFSTQVSLLAGNDSSPKGAGNLLILDDNRGAVGLDGEGRVNIEVKFVNEDLVAIEYPAAARVFHREARRDGVEVRYDLRPR